MSCTSILYFFLQSVLKDLWLAAKLVSCKGMKYLDEKIYPIYIFAFCLGLDDWIPSINNMMWHAFSSCQGNIFNCNLTKV